MPWQRATQSQNPRPAQAVPEGESVRLAALQAAWRRDHWVAKRRIWWRWALWGAQRYGLPALAGVGILLGVWFAVRATTGWFESPSPTKPVAAYVPPSTSAATPTVVPPTTLDKDNGMTLTFDRSTHTSTLSETPVSSPARSEAAENLHPPLISENWLHSKEP